MGWGGAGQRCLMGGAMMSQGRGGAGRGGASGATDPSVPKEGKAEVFLVLSFLKFKKSAGRGEINCS